MPRQDPRLKLVPRSVNEEIADRAVRHLLFLTRLQSTEAAEAIKLFDQHVIPDVLAQIEKRIAKIAEKGFDTGPVTTRRLQQLAAALDKITGDWAKVATADSTDALIEIAKSEVGFESGMLKQTVPVNIELNLPPVGVIAEAVKTAPFEGKILKDWWGGLGQTTRNGILQQVKIGLVAGETTTQIARRLRTNSFVTARHHASAVAHSAVIHASAQARMRLYENNKDLIKGIQWVATLDDRTCPECGSLDGQVFPLDNPTLPPAHVNCFVGDTPVLSRTAIRSATKRWFDGDVVVVRTAGGKDITVTPNHPILTGRGWVAAGALHEGDNVVCDSGVEWVAATVDGDAQYTPASIKNISKAFVVGGEALSVEVPITAKDFHGDGVDGEVAIINTDRSLLSKSDTSLFENAGKVDLILGDSGRVPLVRNGALVFFLFGMLSAPHCFMCGGGVGPSLGWGQASHSDSVGLAGTSGSQTGISQDSIDDLTADAALARHLQNGNAGPVHLDNVVSVDRHIFRGHVYNLETEGGYYAANGIIAHNCRCTTVPVTKSFEELGFKTGELPEGTRASMNGQVPSSLTYNEWLKKQSFAIQKEALGSAKKAELFRKGGLPINRFVAKGGKPLTLAELEAKEADVFEAVFGPTKVTRAAKKTAAELQAASELEKIATGGKGLSVKNIALKQLEKEGALEGLTAQDALLAVTDRANAIQAMKTLQGKLSKAKKKLIDGKPLAPFEQNAIDSLDDAARADFFAAIKGTQEQGKWQGQVKATIAGEFDSKANPFLSHTTKQALGDADLDTLGTDDAKLILKQGSDEAEAAKIVQAKYIDAEPGSPEKLALNQLETEVTKVVGSGIPEPLTFPSLTPSQLLKKLNDGLEAAIKAQAEKAKKALIDTAVDEVGVAKTMLTKVANGKVPELKLAASDLDKLITGQLDEFNKLVNAGSLDAAEDALKGLKSLASNAADLEDKVDMIGAINLSIQETAKLPNEIALKVLNKAGIGSTDDLVKLSVDDLIEKGLKLDKAIVEAQQEVAEAAAKQTVIDQINELQGKALSDLPDEQLNNLFAKMTPIESNLDAMKAASLDDLQKAVASLQDKVTNAFVQAEKVTEFDDFVDTIKTVDSAIKSKLPEIVEGSVIPDPDIVKSAVTKVFVDVSEKNALNIFKDMLEQTKFLDEFTFNTTPQAKLKEAFLIGGQFFDDVKVQLKTANKLSEVLDEALKLKSQGGPVKKALLDEAADVMNDAVAQLSNAPGSLIDNLKAAGLDNINLTLQSSVDEIQDAIAKAKAVTATPRQVLSAQISDAIDDLEDLADIDLVHKVFDSAGFGLQTTLDKEGVKGVVKTLFADPNPTAKKLGDKILASLKEAKSSATSSLKQAAEQAFPDFATAQKFIDDLADGVGKVTEKEAFKKLTKSGQIQGMTAQEAASVIKAEAQVIQAAKSKASALSQAKKKIVAGKEPTPAQQSVIDSLTPSEKETFDQAVAKLVADKDNAALAIKRTEAAADDVLLGDDLPRVGPKPGGSVPGYLSKHRGTGETWIVKTPSSIDIARNEVLAAKLYQRAGVDVPDIRLVRFADGSEGVASKVIDGVKVDGSRLKKIAAGNGADAAKIHENFVVDAWLSNWDVVGLDFDNLTFGPGGRILRIDVGGALRYRAQGGFKGQAFADTVDEIDSLRSATNRQAREIFSHANQEQLEAGVRKVLAISDDEIADLVRRFGPDDDLIAGELIDTLIARKKDLAKRFPNAAKPKAKPAPSPDADELVTEIDAKRIEQARQNGYQIPVDKDQIEDQALLVNFERNLQGNPVTLAAGKLRADAADRLSSLVQRSAGELPDVDDGGTFNSFLEAIKGIGSQANKGEVLREKDIARAIAAKDQYDDGLRKLKRRVEAGEFEADVIEQYETHFSPYLKLFDDVIERGEGSSFTLFNLPTLNRWNPKVKVPDRPTDEITWVRKSGFQQKKIERGFAQETDQLAYESREAVFFEAEIDGSVVRFWPSSDHTLSALKNRIEIVVEGDTLASARRAVATLERLGVNAKRATELDREELYLNQIAWHMRDNWGQYRTKVSRLKSQEARVKRAKEFLSEQLGVEDISALPGYNYEGVRQAFDNGRNLLLRPDFVGDEWDSFSDQYRLTHSLYGSTAEQLDHILNSGGMLAPTTDKLRRGIQLHGMSPTSDLGTGGADYVFTRIAERGSALSDSGTLVWKTSHLRRLDAISYNSDNYGRTNSDRFILGNRKVGINEYRETARRGSNETIFKGGLSIFDDLDAIVVSSRSEQKDVIEVLKRHKIDRWPDGRALDDVVIVRGARR